jgi:LPXTG-motif cell wall-anchored protein
MKKWYTVPALVGILTLGTAAAVEAAPPSTAPTQAPTSDEDGSDKTGLWGLLGLAGLAGLTGLKRRNDQPRQNERDLTTTGTR